jgi:hypothetical protein
MMTHNMRLTDVKNGKPDQLLQDFIFSPRTGWIGPAREISLAFRPNRIRLTQ